MGDLNIDISNNNVLGQELINTMQCFNFEPLIDKPTCVSHIIDHIWMNYFDFPYESGVIECDIADHHIILSVTGQFAQGQFARGQFAQKFEFLF